MNRRICQASRGGAVSRAAVHRSFAEKEHLSGRTHAHQMGESDMSSEESEIMEPGHEVPRMSGRTRSGASGSEKPMENFNGGKLFKMDRLSNSCVFKLIAFVSCTALLIVVSNNCLFSGSGGRRRSISGKFVNFERRAGRQRNNHRPGRPKDNKIIFNKNFGLKTHQSPLDSSVQSFDVLPNHPTRSSPLGNRLQSCSLSDYFLLPERFGTRVELFQPIILKEKKIFRCSIPKNLMTQLKALYCRMILGENHPREDKIAKNPSNIRIRGHGCVLDRIELDGSEDDRLSKLFSSTEWFRFAIIRDPIERFISGYLDRCLRVSGRCYGCGEDIACFARNTYGAFTRIAERGGQVIGGLPTYVHHIMPQYWYCRFSEHLEDYHYIYYNKTEALGKDFREHLLDWGFPEDLIETGWGEEKTDPFLAIRTAHASDLEEALNYKHFVLSHLPTLNYLFQMYIVDYSKFKLEAPFKSAALKLCAEEPDPDKYSICKAYASECG